MKRQMSIQNFFVKKQNVTNDEIKISDTNIPPASVDIVNADSSSTDLPVTIDCHSSQEVLLLTKNRFDIGNFSNESSVRSLTNEERLSLFDNVWKPHREYKFPKVSDLNHTRTFQMKWLEEYKWFAYSEEKVGSFCKYCTIFSRSEFVGKGTHQMVGALVTKPFTNLKKARELFNQHQNCTYHKHAVLTAENIKSVVNKKTKSVINQIDSQRKMNVLENRKKIIPIIQSIRFCGRQQIALRGHRDSGRIELDEPENNDGNFRALLRYRANSGDEYLKKQLLNSGGKSMYTSSVVQNELITMFGQIIQLKIVSNANKSMFYSVLADETTDIGQVEQFSLCLRYVDEDSFKIREDFLMFVPVHEVTGSALAKTVLETLSSLGLDLNKLRGQGYDGASAMSGQFRGVQACIKQTLPLAVYTHCSSHNLNLCLSDASKIPSIRNCMGIISEVCAFFHISAKRTELLKSAIIECCPEQKKKKLISLCETRWVERHDSVFFFKEILQPINLALLRIEEKNSNSSLKAHALSNSLNQYQFIVNLFVLSSMLSVTKNLSEMLQKKNIDLSQAMKSVTNVLKLLKKQRSNVEDYFKTLYVQIKEFADDNDIKEEVPRICRLQKSRCNVPYSSGEEFYRRAVYVPYLDDFCDALNKRFETHKELIFSLQCVLPEFCLKSEFSSLNSAFKFYSEDLSFKEIVQSEFMLWKEKWIKLETVNLPKTAICSLERCDKNSFPNIYILLKLLAVLPVTVATVERSFSTLRRLKTYLRNTKSETRFNGLALLSIHRDINVSDEEVLNKFASVPRNLNFVL